jgi:putative transposase
MRFTLRAESHLERGCFLRLEYDDDVIAYYDQPPSVELFMLSKTGRRLRVRYTPDVLVKRRASLEILEVKTIQACENLVANRPHAWKKTGDGYVYVPARDHFAKWSISFRVVTEAEQNPLETENLELLGRLSRASAGTLRKRQLMNLHSLLEGKVLTIDYLAKRLALTGLSGLIDLVRQKQLHCDIGKSNLSMPEEALVSLDPGLLRSAHEGLARLKVGSSYDAHEILSPTEAAVALKRYEILTGAREPDCCKRTLQLWKKSLGQAKGDIRALSPKWGRCGNWRVLDDSVAKALDEGISGYFKETAESPAQTWLDYRANNPDGVSFPTFLKYLRRREASDQEGCAKARAGQRAANAAASPTLPTLRYARATRPFQRAHCDHKLLNTWVLVGESGGVEYRAKPWLTALYDEATDYVLAWTISLDSPSRRHVARVMRECARRHGRLPEMIVVDGGSDFRSTFFEQFVASRHIEKQERPSGDPRYGSNIERSFGVIKGELTSVLPGNTTNDERKRFASATSKGGKTSVVDIVDPRGFDRGCEHIDQPHAI